MSGVRRRQMLTPFKEQKIEKKIAEITKVMPLLREYIYESKMNNTHFRHGEDDEY